MALDGKLLLIIVITLLHAWTEQTFGVTIDLGRRERSGICIDTDNGATDDWGDSCQYYQGYVEKCGTLDDDDFSANTMCCVCKEALENGYTLIANDRICRHRNAATRELPFCYNSNDVAVNDRSSCASFCTNAASCVGIAFGPDRNGGNECNLYQIDRACPSSDWDFNVGEVFSNFTASDLEAGSWTATGYQCYGKNAAYGVDCEWGSWVEWSTCSKTCGGGEKSRTRQVEVPASNGGQACVGPANETATCNTEWCPVDCEWGSWVEWSTCSKTCGGGKKSRKRQIEVQASHGGIACEGEETETASCNTDLCPVNCEWGPYGEWSSCSKTCGGGKISRTRLVSQPASNGGHPCEGKATETMDCNEAECPEKCWDRKPRNKCRNMMMKGACTKPFWRKHCCRSCKAGCGNLWSNKRCQKLGAFCRRSNKIRNKCRRTCKKC